MTKKGVFFSTLGFGLICAWPTVNIAADANSASLRGATLEDFYTAAISYSPQLKIAEESLKIGSARKRGARGQVLPQISASANLSDNRRNALNTFTDVFERTNFDGERYSVQLRQVLFNWQTFSVRKQADYIEDQYEAEYFYQLAVLLSEVADKYFNVLQAEDALESIESELNAVNNQLAQIQSFYDRQMAQITDLYQAQASLAAVESEKLQLQSELELQREALRAVTGVYAGTLYRLQDDIDIPGLDNSVNYWVQLARSGNQQIQAREFALRAATERISEKRGAYMPTLSLVLQRQDSNIGYENAPSPQSDNTYIGLDLTIPLFAGGSNRAAVSEASSQRAIAEYELQGVQLEIDARVRTAYLQVQSSEARTAAARKLLESTVLSATAMQRGFELGTVTNVDVLNALRNQYQAERDLQQTRYEHVKQLLILKRETGTLSADDLLEVGTWLAIEED